MRVIATSLLALFAGCVDEFQGSNVQFDFSPAMPLSSAISHFTLYAFQTDPNAMVGRLFELQRFEVHPVVDLASPCYIDVGAHVPHPGLHVSMYAQVIAQDTSDSVAVATAEQREANVQALTGATGIKVITSASAGSYAALGADCADPAGIPPPPCTDEASNQRRLAMCQAAWAADTNYYEGTDRVLTVPLNGIDAGPVDGMNPINLAPVGGGQFFINEVLDGFDGYAIYDQPDAQTTPGGTLLLFGTPTMATRGVAHVHMTSSVSPALTADIAIFSNLGQDDVSF